MKSVCSGSIRKTSATRRPTWSRRYPRSNCPHNGLKVSEVMATVCATTPSTAVESLDALLAILESAAHEGAHFSSLLPAFASLQVAASGIAGVNDLLRTWQVLLQRRAAA